MLDDLLRPLKERLLHPLAQGIGQLISPNIMTLISLLLGILSALSILGGNYLVALIFWILNRLTDGLDGTIARVMDRQTDLGGYLDIMADFIIYSIIPLSMVMSRGLIISELVQLAIMLSVFYINAASWMYLAGILEKRQTVNKDVMTSINMPLGVVEGFETIIFYTLFYLFPDSLDILFLIMSVLTLAGVFQRIIWAIRKL